MQTQEQNNKNEIQEILETVNFIKDNAATHADINRLDKRMDSMEGKMDSMEGKMVTKDYLDNKLADLRGDLVVQMRKEDTKLKALLEIMEQKQLLTKSEAAKILAMEPFPQLAL